jgi:hypothetical protein
VDIIVTHVFKEGKRDDFNNHRRITLSNLCYKICAQFYDQFSKLSEMSILKNKLVEAKATPVNLCAEFPQSFT